MAPGLPLISVQYMFALHFGQTGTNSTAQLLRWSQYVSPMS